MFLMANYRDNEQTNVGTGVDIAIRDLAEMVRDIVCPEATLRFDTSKPDGTPRKVLDVTKLNELGWTAKIDLETGIRSTYQWLVDQRATNSEMSGIETAAVAGR